ncbi:MAG: twin-arginine translocation signal domain-containing protein, partial [Victivallales bacterium]|nr:twin-arginine translocation signal domain-containing protein [Victivallales bacterium]
MENQKSRRSFIGKAAAATAGSTLAASPFVNAQPKRKTSSVELIQVGAACLSDNSHMNYRIWAPMINQTDPERWPVGRTTRMRITHCWDRDYTVAQKFAKQYKCEAVKNYYDMVDKVDGMIFAGFNEVKWWKQLSKPYLEAGIPCYLNRPFAYSMKDAKDIVERSKKYDTPILCTDEREFIQQTNIG